MQQICHAGELNLPSRRIDVDEIAGVVQQLLRAPLLPSPLSQAKAAATVPAGWRAEADLVQTESATESVAVSAAAAGEVLLSAGEDKDSYLPLCLSIGRRQQGHDAQGGVVRLWGGMGGAAVSDDGTRTSTASCSRGDVELALTVARMCQGVAVGKHDAAELTRTVADLRCKQMPHSLNDIRGFSNSTMFLLFVGVDFIAFLASRSHH